MSLACATDPQDPFHRQARSPLATADAVEVLRRQRRTQEHIAGELGISRASVSRILGRRGLSLLSSLEPQQPRPRYERKAPGEIIHIDIKKFGRFNRVGHRITGDRTRQSNQRNDGTAPEWEYTHVAIDDHSKIATAAIFPDEKKNSAVAFLIAAVTYYKGLGVIVDRVMTDNGACYKSFAFAKACKRLRIKHIRTKPYTPQTSVRPSASSRPRSANGLTQQPSKTHSSGAMPCPTGCTATTGTGHMPASASCHPSAASTSTGTTS